MPDVTFIHGTANKPPETALRRLWLNALRVNGWDLPTLGTELQMV
jgi:hypothetical protein